MQCSAELEYELTRLTEKDSRILTMMQLHATTGYTVPGQHKLVANMTRKYVRDTAAEL
jgi:hypothetical protein